MDMDHELLQALKALVDRVEHYAPAMAREGDLDDARTILANTEGKLADFPRGAQPTETLAKNPCRVYRVCGAAVYETELTKLNGQLIKAMAFVERVRLGPLPAEGANTPDACVRWIVDLRRDAALIAKSYGL